MALRKNCRRAEGSSGVVAQRRTGPHRAQQRRRGTVALLGRIQLVYRVHAHDAATTRSTCKLWPHTCVRRLPTLPRFVQAIEHRQFRERVVGFGAE